ncbi:hypothetical protein D9619_011236 [Psilocybe cf. subviscida]|uniref:Secreted protein n=1 Tax=Psilocybe cf. subviscida TaxID=2480587 RepID=A0A8H5BIX7_9AGAR|nr:hypothetical protein D9619_011236 [Psilocybe cf. subviscida]
MSRASILVLVVAVLAIPFEDYNLGHADTQTQWDPQITDGRIAGRRATTTAANSDVLRAKPATEADKRQEGQVCWKRREMKAKARAGFTAVTGQDEMILTLESRILRVCVVLCRPNGNRSKAVRPTTGVGEGGTGGGEKMLRVALTAHLHLHSPSSFTAPGIIPVCSFFVPRRRCGRLGSSLPPAKPRGRGASPANTSMRTRTADTNTRVVVRGP